LGIEVLFRGGNGVGLPSIVSNNDRDPIGGGDAAAK
jgi:hypothetical protein